MRKSPAFSLVELSIVLVILGLLVGGVLAGQSLIRASELRAVATEKSRWETARNAFRDKYFTLPGDFASAYQAWGAGCGTNASTISTGCNGDGDGKTEYLTGENLKAWEQLALASMADGNYNGTGVASAGGGLVATSTNVPTSRLSGGYWDMTDFAGNGNGLTDGMAVLVFGGLSASSEGALDPHPSLKRQEAWNIDMKMDDGKANTGKVRGDGRANCSDDGTDYYSLSTGAQTIDCAMYFLL